MDADDLGLEGIIPGAEDEKEPEPEPEPTKEIVLLTEIRDLMKVEAQRPKIRVRIVTQPPAAE